MALVTLPEGQQRSGKQGGIVWSHNAGGPYIRNRAIPTNPSSERQQVVRNLMTLLIHRFFETLTSAQREQWRAYAAIVTYKNRLGATIMLKPAQMYIACNLPRGQAGAAYVDDGPATLSKANGPTTFTPTASEATQLISVAFNNADPWATEAGGYLLLYQGSPIAGTSAYLKVPRRYAGKITGATPTPPTSPQTFTAPFVFQATQKLPLMARVTRADGRLSDPFLYVVTAAA